jgi:hypothetical protein
MPAEGLQKGLGSMQSPSFVQATHFPSAQAKNALLIFWQSSVVLQGTWQWV